MFLYRSNQVESLFQLLTENIAESTPLPFEEEWVVVQNKAMSDWLSMQLASKLGVWANQSFPFPKKVIVQCLEAFLGEKALHSKQYASDQLFIPIYQKLLLLYKEPEFASLRKYFEEPAVGTKRITSSQTNQIQLSLKIANQFDQYALFHPEWVLAWQDGDFKDLPESQKWQGILWKAVTDELGPTHIAALAEEYFQVVGRSTPNLDKLPKRIFIFGLSSLPPQYLRILAAIHEYVPVSYFLLSPSQKYWGHIQKKKSIFRRLRRENQNTLSLEHLKTAEDLHLEEGNRLLATWGRVGREFQILLETDIEYLEEEQTEGRGYLKNQSTTLLSHLQNDILELGETAISDTKILTDESLSIHSCHSAIREVEVLKDLLAGLIQDQGYLPQDILVMTPNLPEYRPLIDQVFSKKELYIPYSFSDISIEEDNPYLIATKEVFLFLQERFTAPMLKELLQISLIQEKYHLDAEALKKLESWFEAANIRWGIDAEHRSEYDLPAFSQNSWEEGLNRLVLGMAAAMDQEEIISDHLTLPVIEGSESEIFGFFLDFYETLKSIYQEGKASKTILGWQQFTLQITEKLFANNSQQAEAKHELIKALAELTEKTGFLKEEALTLQSYSILLKHHLQELPSNRGFLTYGVTFSGLMPMRSIPFKVIAVIGLTEGQFPRHSLRNGFDLMVDHPILGERIKKEEDRYLFLESLLSAREKLILTYIGQSIKDNKPLPPSVVISDLLDYLQDLSDMTKKDLPNHHVQPLQPYDAKYFTADSGYQSYSESAYHSAVSLMNPLQPEKAAMQKNDTSPPQTVDLISLEKFFKAPAGTYYKSSVGLYYEELPETLQHREPLGLDQLQSHLLADEIFKSEVTKKHLDASLKLHTGALPPGNKGKMLLEEIQLKIEPLIQRWKDLNITSDPLPPVHGKLQQQDITLHLELTNLFPEGKFLLESGKLNGTRILKAWLEHLALCFIQPAGVKLETTLLCIDKTVTFTAFEAPEAQLQVLLEQFLLGHQEPLAFFPKSSWVYVTELENNEDKALGKANSTYNGYLFPEKDDLYIQKAFGGSSLKDLNFTKISELVFLNALSCYQTRD